MMYHLKFSFRRLQGYRLPTTISGPGRTLLLLGDDRQAVVLLQAGPSGFICSYRHRLNLLLVAKVYCCYCLASFLNRKSIRWPTP